MEYRHTVLLQDVTPAADGTRDDELPVNPLSHLVFTIKCLNNSAKATLAQILGALEEISVLRNGSAVITVRAADLFALNCFLWGNEPHQENVVDTDNATRAITLVIPFGRKLYDPNECLPATERGELFLHTQFDIADTGYDGLILQVETIELLGASPKQHLKYTTLTYTPSATGEGDVALPIGNRYLGVLLWGTTVYTGTAWTNTIERVTLLANNVEKYYRQANWESLHGNVLHRAGAMNAWSEKFHTENTATMYTQNADTSAEEQDDSDISNYSYMDFDPDRMGTFMFDSKGLSDLSLRIDAGDTNATRIIPVQLMTPM